MAQRVKNLPIKQEALVPSLGWGDLLEKKMQPTPVFLPGKSRGQRNLVGYSLWGHKRVGHDLATKQWQTLVHKGIGRQVLWKTTLSLRLVWEVHRLDGFLTLWDVCSLFSLYSWRCQRDCCYRRLNKMESSIKVIREEDDHCNLSTLKNSTADGLCH